MARLEDRMTAGLLRKDAVDPETRIGHVHLKVSDLSRALDFYCDVLGFS